MRNRGAQAALPPANQTIRWSRICLPCRGSSEDLRFLVEAMNVTRSKLIFRRRILAFMARPQEAGSNQLGVQTRMQWLPGVQAFLNSLVQSRSDFFLLFVLKNPSTFASRSVVMRKSVGVLGRFDFIRERSGCPSVSPWWPFRLNLTYSLTPLLSCRRDARWPLALPPPPGWRSTGLGCSPRPPQQPVPFISRRPGCPGRRSGGLWEAFRCGVRGTFPAPAGKARCAPRWRCSPGAASTSRIPTRQVRIQGCHWDGCTAPGMGGVVRRGVWGG